MNTNLENAKLPGMDTPQVTLRRKKLAQWVALNGIPQKERSLFSQLRGTTTSFGEKVARRLEIEYKMGRGYLDTEDAKPVSIKPAENKLGTVLNLMVETPQELEFLAVYRLADDDERKAINRVVSVVRARLNASAVGNKKQ